MRQGGFIYAVKDALHLRAEKLAEEGPFASQRDILYFFGFKKRTRRREAEALEWDNVDIWPS